MPDEATVQSFLIEAVETLVREGRVDRVILFGSRAWGTPDTDSDVDLLVIVESSLPQFERRIALRRLIDQSRHRVPLDLLALTSSEVRERIAMGDPFIREILERGRNLHAA